MQTKETRKKNKSLPTLSMATLFLFSLVLLSVSSSALVSSTFINAVEILSGSGYLSMALTLEITSKTLNLESSAATIFAPWDLAFARSGQPSILLLQYHMSPLRLSRDDLKTLPFGTRIPTLLPNHSLIVTTSSDYLDGQLSINGVLIQESALVDNGSIVIYGINQFFNSTFEIPTSLAPEPSPSPTTPGLRNKSQHESSTGFDDDLFGQISDLLMPRGYSIMATFLDVQLFGFNSQTRLTIFAPIDEAIEAYSKNVTDYSLLFRRHVVPGLFPWQDLAAFNDGTSLPTFSGGFMINVTTSGDVLVLNGVPVIFPDMFSSDWIMVHCINQLLMSATKQELAGQSFSELGGGDQPNLPDYDEYGYGSP